MKVVSILLGQQSLILFCYVEQPFMNYYEDYYATKKHAVLAASSHYSLTNWADLT